MTRSVAAITLVLLANPGCSPQGDSDRDAQQSKTPTEQTEKLSNEPAAMLSPEEQAGMYRWSGGMQMGILWAAVKNKRGDALRFEDTPADDGSAAWSVPTVELADEVQAQNAAKGDQMNFVVGGKGWTFGFDSDGTSFSPTPMSTSGHSDAIELVEALQTSKARIVCVEFPKSDYRTCFSLAGAAEALGIG